jgi:hypothetical protein
VKARCRCLPGQRRVCSSLLRSVSMRDLQILAANRETPVRATTYSINCGTICRKQAGYRVETQTFTREAALSIGNATENSTSLSTAAHLWMGALPRWSSCLIFRRARPIGCCLANICAVAVYENVGITDRSYRFDQILRRGRKCYQTKDNLVEVSSFRVVICPRANIGKHEPAI